MYLYISKNFILIIFLIVLKLLLNATVILIVGFNIRA